MRHYFAVIWYHKEDEDQGVIPLLIIPLSFPLGTMIHQIVDINNKQSYIKKRSV